MRGVAAEKRGRLAELLCVIVLRLTGWRVVARRVKAGRGTGLGEIDIVARRGTVIAFIEVKARADITTAAESVTAAQRQRIARNAEAYLRQHASLENCDIRFDVMVLGAGLFPRRIIDAWRPQH
jgi:putative endonuclease